MQSSWIDRLRGVVTIRVRGGSPETLVNLAAAGGLRLRNARRTSGGELECELSVRDFFRLRPYLKRTGCRVHVTVRRGLPFELDKLSRRKFFAAGMVLFVIGIYLLSSLVWKLEIEGNRTLSDERILAAAQSEGLYPFQWTFRLKPVDEIAKRLTAKLPGTAWVGVERTGTKVLIRVVELTVPEPRQLYDPRHIIAKEDAVVTSILAEAGRPVVGKNTRVRRGDILISGTLGEGETTVTVPAKGTVRGLVWHEYHIVAPLTRTTKVYTGERRTQWFAVAFGRALQVSGFGKTKYASHDTVDREEKAAWRSYPLPFGRIKRTILETRIERTRISESEAKAEGLLQAKADLLGKIGPDATVRAQKILHEKTENGKVYMDVLFEADQSIAAEMPLVSLPQ